MANDPTAPIVRLTPDDRVANFNAKSNSIYNKFSEHESTSGGGLRLGFQQPYVYTHISDSNFSKHITKYDSQAFPLGSTIRDVKRLGKFMASGTGLLFIGKQFLIQRQTAFNETRLYNPLSILAAAAQQGSTGLINKPTRYLEGGASGIVNFAKTAVMSTLGMKAAPINSEVKGVASGAISNYAKLGILSKGKGFIHFESGKNAQDRFNSMWVSEVSNTNGGKGGFLKKLGASLLAKLIPSTMPFGFGSKNVESNWVFRPEYPIDKDGAFHSMLDDKSKFLKFSINSISYLAKDIHKNYPGIVAKNNGIELAEKNNWYTENKQSSNDLYNGKLTELKSLYVDMSRTLFKWNKSSIGKTKGNLRLDREQSNETINDNYAKSLGGLGDAPTKFTEKLTDPLTLDKRGFAKSKFGDSYNMMEVFESKRISNGDAPGNLTIMGDSNNSADIIYFYFYDVINSKYIPFRATITGINDQHSADWEEISYLGRADKLYIYKGFTREVNFNFTVYANSLSELVPMWTRINYLVGLSRPSKYTSPDSTKSFMYPPMTTIRIGDMFVDQPCVIKSTGVTIPEDATWETQRGEVPYTYLQGTGTTIGAWNSLDYLSKYNTGKMYQLPTKVDISINMSIMEKEKSMGNDDHYFVSPETLNRKAKEASDKIAKEASDKIDAEIKSNNQKIISAPKSFIPNKFSVVKEKSLLPTKLTFETKAISKLDSTTPTPKEPFDG